MSLVLTLTEMFEQEGGKYSILADNRDFSMWIMERCWRFNRQYISCVPRDEYTLEVHNGEKYKGTYALIGDAVGHYEEEGKPRFACVFHQAVFPKDLKGCFAPARSIGNVGQAIGSREAMDDLLAFLNPHKGGIKILCQ